MAKCRFTKPDGESCNANALQNSNFCFNHDPNQQVAKLVAVTKGGLNRKLYKQYGEPYEIETPEDIKNLLAETINLVRTGKMPASQPANSIAYLCRCWLDANTSSEVEARIEAIEEKLEKAKL